MPGGQPDEPEGYPFRRLIISTVKYFPSVKLGRQWDKRTSWINVELWIGLRMKKENKA